MTSLIFRPYDFRHITAKDEYSTDSFHIYGLNEKSETLILRIDNAPAIKRFLLKDMTRYQEVYDLLTYLFSDCIETTGDLTGINLRKGKQLYYYRKNQQFFFIIVFRNKFLLDKTMRSISRNKTFQETLFPENNHVDQILYYITQRKLSFSDWLICENCFSVNEEKNKISRVKEYTGLRSNLRKAKEEEIPKVKLYPKFMAYDLEVNSRDTISFPKAQYPSNYIYMISVIIWQNDQIKRYILTWLDTYQFEGAEIILYENEEQLIRGFFDIIKKEQPNLITGYNIFGFDNEYLNTRRIHCAIDIDEIDCGYIKKSQVIFREESTAKANPTDKSYTMNITGIIEVDLLTYVRMTYQRNSYKLDSVGEDFLREGKHDMPAREMFKICQFSEKIKNQLKSDEEVCEDDIIKAVDDMTRVAKYCNQDSDLVRRLFDFFNLWTILNEFSNVMSISIENVFLKGMQIRCFSLIFNYAFPRGYILCGKIYGEKKPYEGAFVFPPKHGRKTNISTADFSALYPSIIQENNLCYTTMIPVTKELDGSYKLPGGINREDVLIFEFTEKEYVYEKKKKGKKPTGNTLNFIYAYYQGEPGILPTICRDLVAARQRVKDALKIEKDPIMKMVLTAREMAIKASANSIYGFTGAKYAYLPCYEVAQSITAIGRKSIGKVASYVIEIYSKKILEMIRSDDIDQAFLFIKEKINELGNNYAKTNIDEVVFEILEFITDKMDSFGGSDIVYGDTDSVMIDWNTPSTKVAFELAATVTKQITKYLFLPPMRLEDEKTAREMILLGKKNYQMKIVKDKNNPDNPKYPDEILARGDISVRREYCKYIKDVYRKMMDYCLNGDKLSTIMSFLMESIRKLINQEVPLDQLVFVNSVTGNYDPDIGSYMKLFVERLTRDGQPPKAGDRLEYLIVDNNEDKLGNKLMLLDEVREKPDIKIDVKYYLAKKMKKRFDDVIRKTFEASLPEEIANKGCTFGRMRNKSFCIEPINFIANGLKYGEKFDELAKVLVNVFRGY